MAHRSTAPPNHKDHESNVIDFTGKRKQPVAQHRDRLAVPRKEMSLTRKGKAVTAGFLALSAVVMFKPVTHEVNSALQGGVEYTDKDFNKMHKQSASSAQGVDGAILQVDPKIMNGHDPEGRFDLQNFLDKQNQGGVPEQYTVPVIPGEQNKQGK